MIKYFERPSSDQPGRWMELPLEDVICVTAEMKCTNVWYINQYGKVAIKVIEQSVASLLREHSEVLIPAAHGKAFNVNFFRGVDRSKGSEKSATYTVHLDAKVDGKYLTLRCSSGWGCCIHRDFYTGGLLASRASQLKSGDLVRVPGNYTSNKHMANCTVDYVIDDPIKKSPFGYWYLDVGVTTPCGKHVVIPSVHLTKVTP